MFNSRDLSIQVVTNIVFVAQVPLPSAFGTVMNYVNIVRPPQCSHFTVLHLQINLQFVPWQQVGCVASIK